MKKLVVAFIGIGSLVGIFLVFALFFPKEVSVKETIVINASSDIVYNNVNDLTNWPKWMPWLDQDSTLKLSFNETVQGENASYTWINNNGETGSLTITKSSANEIITEVEFGNTESSSCTWSFDNTAEGTIVSWQMEFPVSYPMNIMSSMMKEAIRLDLQKGLQNLKQASEDGQN